MDTIYIVVPYEGYWDSMLKGFATDAEGVELIIREHFREFLYTELTDVRVNMDDLTVTFVVPEDNYEETYFIREIERITCD